MVVPKHSDSELKDRSVKNSICDIEVGKGKKKEDSNCDESKIEDVNTFVAECFYKQVIFTPVETKKEATEDDKERGEGEVGEEEVGLLVADQDTQVSTNNCCQNKYDLILILISQQSAKHGYLTVLRLTAE